MYMWGIHLTKTFLGSCKFLAAYQECASQIAIPLSVNQRDEILIQCACEIWWD